MRQGSHARRSRNRGTNPHHHAPQHVGGHPQQRRQQPLRPLIYDSQGPDARYRGTALQLYERYTNAARDAASSHDDPVFIETLFQHAEHYLRLHQDEQEGRQDPGRSDRPGYRPHPQGAGYPGHQGVPAGPPAQGGHGQGGHGQGGHGQGPGAVAPGQGAAPGGTGGVTAPPSAGPPRQPPRPKDAPPRDHRPPSGRDQGLRDQGSGRDQGAGDAALSDQPTMEPPGRDAAIRTAPRAPVEDYQDLPAFLLGAPGDSRRATALQDSDPAETEPLGDGQRADREGADDTAGEAGGSAAPRRRTRTPRKVARTRRPAPDENGA